MERPMKTKDIMKTLNESNLTESYDMYNVVEDTQSAIRVLIKNLESAKKSGDMIMIDDVVKALNSILSDIDRMTNEAW